MFTTEPIVGRLKDLVHWGAYRVEHGVGATHYGECRASCRGPARFVDADCWCRAAGCPARFEALYEGVMATIPYVPPGLS